MAVHHQARAGLCQQAGKAIAKMLEKNSSLTNCRKPTQSRMFY